MTMFCRKVGFVIIYVFLALFFLWSNMCLCYLYRFFQLCMEVDKVTDEVTEQVADKVADEVANEVADMVTDKWPTSWLTRWLH